MMWCVVQIKPWEKLAFDIKIERESGDCNGNMLYMSVYVASRGVNKFPDTSRVDVPRITS